MQKKLWIILALLVVVPGLLFTVSCAKKAVKSEPSISQMPKAEVKADQDKQKEDERKKQEEMERQRRMEEERLKEARMKAEAEKQAKAARDKFVNEDIHFDFDSSTLLPAAQGILKEKAAWMRDNPKVSAIIEGHCDERGTSEYNLALGDRRAASAKTFLVDLGISGSRLSTISYGKERPLDPGHNEDAWAKNRRAHFVVE